MATVPEFMYAAAPLPALVLTSAPFFRPVSYIQDGCVWVYRTAAAAAAAVPAPEAALGNAPEWVVLQLRTAALACLQMDNEGGLSRLTDGRIPSAAVVEPLLATRSTADGHFELTPQSTSPS